MNAPEIPVSWGELIDKITILEIKAVKLRSRTALANVNAELSLLRAKIHPEIAARSEIISYKQKLADINGQLWQIEERIRQMETAQQFDREFVELARLVYKRNDERALLKRKINSALNSGLSEEKSFFETI